MPESKTSVGMAFRWEGEHRDGEGRLISQNATLPAPQLTCLKPKCVYRYLVKAWRHAFVLTYHAERVKYAEAHRYEEIPEKYRTGDPSPSTVIGAIWEIIKLPRR